MKKISKVTAILLALILAVGLFAATTFATEETGLDSNRHSRLCVDYHRNGASGSAPSDEWYGWGDWVTVKDKNTLYKTGYTFKEWNTESDGSGHSVHPGDHFRIYYNVDLYSQWEINSYTMSFDSEGGSAVASVTQDYNTLVEQPESPTKEGYTFAGWYTGDGGTGSAVVFPYTLTEDITVYAKWDINYYTMVFNSEGGTSVTPVTQAYNTKIAAPESPTRYGFTFDGWYTGSLGTGTKVAFPYTIKNSITVHAKWVAKTYTLKFDSEGGSAVASQSRYYGEYINAPANPTKDGYTFDGWYLGDNGTGSKAVFPYNIVGNATVYAKWIKIAVVSEVSVPAASSTPAVSSVPSTATSSTPTPTSVPEMGEQGVDATAITVIILTALMISGLAVFGLKKLRSEK